MSSEKVVVKGKAELMKALKEKHEEIGRKEFCQITGMREPNVSNLVNERKYHSTDKLVEIADCLGISVSISFSLPNKKAPKS